MSWPPASYPIGPLGAHAPFDAMIPRCGFFVAPALGFTVTRAVMPNTPYSKSMAALFPNVRFETPGGRKRGRSSPVDVIFAGIDSLPHHHQSYWSYTLTPHVVDGPTVRNVPPPRGWSATSIWFGMPMLVAALTGLIGSHCCFHLLQTPSP